MPSHPPRLPVIGLEIHAELMTGRKLFCSCLGRYGDPPNTNVCPICTGVKDARPILDRDAVTLALRAGLALGCEINRRSSFDRKHYTYPDLPKGYQITQYFHPICLGGALDVGGRSLPLSRIHIEEDAGKLSREADGTLLVDLNRAGVPLIEIVTEPILHTPSEAGDFLRALRELLLFLGVCDGKMNEGSLRCDVNLSLTSPDGKPGQRTEIKNLNSFRFVEKAIAAEIARQNALLDRGEAVPRQTLRYDERTCLTVPMREKEESADYGYAPEPHLPPLILTEEEILAERAALPPLPRALRALLTEKHGLRSETVDRLMSHPDTVRRFLAASDHTAFGGKLAELILHPASAEGSPSALGALAELVGKRRIDGRGALRLLPRLSGGRADVLAEAEAEGLLAPEEEAIPTALIDAVIAEHGDKLTALREGNGAMVGFFIGAVKRRLSAPASSAALAEAVRARLQSVMEESK